MGNSNDIKGGGEGTKDWLSDFLNGDAELPFQEGHENPLFSGVAPLVNGAREAAADAYEVVQRNPLAGQDPLQIPGVADHLPRVNAAINDWLLEDAFQLSHAEGIGFVNPDLIGQALSGDIRLRYKEPMVVPVPVLDVTIEEMRFSEGRVTAVQGNWLPDELAGTLSNAALVGGISSAPLPRGSYVIENQDGSDLSLSDIDMGANVSLSGLFVEGGLHIDALGPEQNSMVTFKYNGDKGRARSLWEGDYEFEDWNLFDVNSVGISADRVSVDKIEFRTPEGNLVLTDLAIDDLSIGYGKTSEGRPYIHFANFHVEPGALASLPGVALTDALDLPAIDLKIIWNPQTQEYLHLFSLELDENNFPEFAVALEDAPIEELVATLKSLRAKRISGEMRVKANNEPVSYAVRAEEVQVAGARGLVDNSLSATASLTIESLEISGDFTSGRSETVSFSGAHVTTNVAAGASVLAAIVGDVESAEVNLQKLPWDATDDAPVLYHADVRKAHLVSSRIQLPGGITATLTGDLSGTIGAVSRNDDAFVPDLFPLVDGTHLNFTGNMVLTLPDGETVNYNGRLAINSSGQGVRLTTSQPLQVSNGLNLQAGMVLRFPTNEHRGVAYYNPFSDSVSARHHVVATHKDGLTAVVQGSARVSGLASGNVFVNADLGTTTAQVPGIGEPMSIEVSGGRLVAQANLLAGRANATIISDDKTPLQVAATMSYPLAKEVAEAMGGDKLVITSRFSPRQEIKLNGSLKDLELAITNAAGTFAGEAQIELLKHNGSYVALGTVDLGSSFALSNIALEGTTLTTALAVSDVEIDASQLSDLVLPGDVMLDAGALAAMIKVPSMTGEVSIDLMSMRMDSTWSVPQQDVDVSVANGGLAETPLGITDALFASLDVTNSSTVELSAGLYGLDVTVQDSGDVPWQESVALMGAVDSGDGLVDAGGGGSVSGGPVNLSFGGKTGAKQLRFGFRTKEQRAALSLEGVSAETRVDGYLEDVMGITGPAEHNAALHVDGFGFAWDYNTNRGSLMLQSVGDSYAELDPPEDLETWMALPESYWQDRSAKLQAGEHVFVIDGLDDLVQGVQAVIQDLPNGQGNLYVDLKDPNTKIPAEFALDPLKHMKDMTAHLVFRWDRPAPPRSVHPEQQLAYQAAEKVLYVVTDEPDPKLMDLAVSALAADDVDGWAATDVRGQFTSGRLELETLTAHPFFARFSETALENLVQDAFGVGSNPNAESARRFFQRLVDWRMQYDSLKDGTKVTDWDDDTGLTFNRVYLDDADREGLTDTGVASSSASLVDAPFANVAAQVLDFGRWANWHSAITRSKALGGSRYEVTYLGQKFVVETRVVQGNGYASLAYRAVESSTDDVLVFDGQVTLVEGEDGNAWVFKDQRLDFNTAEAVALTQKREAKQQARADRGKKARTVRDGNERVFRGSIEDLESRKSDGDLIQRTKAFAARWWLENMSPDPNPQTNFPYIENRSSSYLEMVASGEKSRVNGGGRSLLRTVPMDTQATQSASPEPLKFVEEEGGASYVALDLEALKPAQQAGMRAYMVEQAGFTPEDVDAIFESGKITWDQIGNIDMVSGNPMGVKKMRDLFDNDNPYYTAFKGLARVWLQDEVPENYGRSEAFQARGERFLIMLSLIRRQMPEVIAGNPGQIGVATVDLAGSHFHEWDRNPFDNVGNFALTVMSPGHRFDVEDLNTAFDPGNYIKYLPSVYKRSEEVDCPEGFDFENRTCYSQDLLLGPMTRFTLLADRAVMIDDGVIAIAWDDAYVDVPSGFNGSDANTGVYLNFAMAGGRVANLRVGYFGTPQLTERSEQALNMALEGLAKWDRGEAKIHTGRPADYLMLTPETQSTSIWDYQSQGSAAVASR